jgi:hypothetical protein
VRDAPWFTLVAWNGYNNPFRNMKITPTTTEVDDNNIIGAWSSIAFEDADGDGDLDAYFREDVGWPHRGDGNPGDTWVFSRRNFDFENTQVDGKHLADFTKGIRDLVRGDASIFSSESSANSGLSHTLSSSSSFRADINFDEYDDVFHLQNFSLSYGGAAEMNAGGEFQSFSRDAGSTVDRDNHANPFRNLGVGPSSFFTFVDIDNDGDMDGFAVDAQTGRIYFFFNPIAEFRSRSACFNHGFFLNDARQAHIAELPLGYCLCAEQWDPASNCATCASGRWGGLCQFNCPVPFPSSSFQVDSSCNGQGDCDDGLTGNGTCNCRLPYSGVACSSCSPGFKAANLTSAVVCTPCQPGKHSISSTATACAKCPDATITVDGKECIECMYPLVPNAAQTACQPCGDGMRPSKGKCVECPRSVNQGVSCDGGKLKLNEGFWFNTSATLTNESHIIQCVFEGACMVNSSVAMNSSQNQMTLLSTSEITQTESDEPILFCADGYKGVLCAECEHGYTRSKTGCHKCPDGDRSLFEIFVVPSGVFTVVCCLAVICLAVRTSRMVTTGQGAAGGSANEKLSAVAAGQLEGAMEDAADDGLEDMAAGVCEDADATASESGNVLQPWAATLVKARRILGQKGKILISVSSLLHVRPTSELHSVTFLQSSNS